MRTAKENQYFEAQNKAAIERIKVAGVDRVRKSPITGEPMKHEALMGVIVDRCPTSGGIWLDAGELEQILGNVGEEHSKATSFLGSLFGGKR